MMLFKQCRQLPLVASRHASRCLPIHWVVEAALKRAERSLPGSCAMVTTGKAAYVQSGQQAVWTTYFNQLQSIHARKRKLMDLFKQLHDT